LEKTRRVKGEDSEDKSVVDSEEVKSTQHMVGIFAFNDIYQHEHFPNIISLIQLEKVNYQYTILSVQGDFISGGAEVKFDKGETMVKILVEAGKLVNERLYILGNHELDYSITLLKQRLNTLQENGWKLLNTNYNIEDKEDYIIMDMDKFVKRQSIAGQKLPLFGTPTFQIHPFTQDSIYGDFSIGVTGTLYDRAPIDSACSSDALFKKTFGGCRMEKVSDREAVRRGVKLLKDEGVNYVISLTHFTDEKDKEMFNNPIEEEKDIHLTLGAHSHDCIYEEKKYDGVVGVVDKQVLAQGSLDAKELILVTLHVKTPVSSNLHEDSTSIYEVTTQVKFTNMGDSRCKINSMVPLPHLELVQPATKASQFVHQLRTQISEDDYVLGVVPTNEEIWNLIHEGEIEDVFPKPDFIPFWLPSFLAFSGQVRRCCSTGGIGLVHLFQSHKGHSQQRLCRTCPNFPQ